ncbi:MAG TPA: DegT/DnrJ/EryC1/StrS family aminotransferase [Fimbriimonadaceae bacterium]|nr:DegT/DnrJ/EryC1/StrS family aminotransferase [Fimbriimonadaceae bacterium]
MPIFKTSPSQLAIHGGGPAAFESKLPAITANAGDGRRFAELAERMFLATETPGSLAAEFERKLASWFQVGNVVGFSSNRAAVHAIHRASGHGAKVFVPAFGAESFLIDQTTIGVECEPFMFGMSPAGLAEQLREDAAAVFALNPLGRTCMIEDIQDICDEWGVPLFFSSPQSLGCSYKGDRLGRFGHAEIFELGRDQLVHAMDAAVIVTDDDLLAHRLRVSRTEKEDHADPAMSDAAAAMGIANLESVSAFAEANQTRYEIYEAHLRDLPGISLVRHSPEGTYQCVAVEVNRSEAGLTKDSLYDILAAENVGSIKAVDSRAFAGPPVSARLAGSLLRLPSGPHMTEESIVAVCKLVELAIVRSLESPDPLQMAA